MVSSVDTDNDFISKLVASVEGGLSLSSMAYKTSIVSAIEDLKDSPPGSSLAAIQKHVRASLPPGKVWKSAVFLRSLKLAVDRGDLVQTEDRFRLSPEFKKRRAEEIEDRMAKEAAKSHVTPKSPPSVKQAPKFKPALVKRKLLDTKVITVVKEGRRTEKMELDREAAEKSRLDHKCSPKKKGEAAKAKIIPRKVLVKKAIKDPMKTT